MNAALSIILNKTILYNKKTAICFFISLYLVVFLTFFDKGLNTSFGNLFLILTLYISISICLFRLMKEKNYEFHKFSFNKGEYKLCSRKEKIICYNKSFNRILINKICTRDLDFYENENIRKLLLNFNNNFITELMKSITFERFNDYFINSKENKTTGELFNIQFRSSLVKIIKDFIIKTNELEDISNETISKFIQELTNIENLNFNSDNGLHYNDKFVLEFLKSYKEQQPIIQLKETNYLPKKIKQIELKRISKTQFYNVLEKTSIDVLKVKLTKENQEELKSFVGNLFTTKIKCDFSYDSNITKLNFINSDNLKLFIIVMRYLQDKTMIDLFNIDLIRTLDLIIKNDSIITDSNKRISFIKSITYQKLTPKQAKNIDNILLN